jgi:uncharacterized protein (TIGR00255 family)
MTGLGIGEIETPTRTIRVEIKTINSRFMEISCRLPLELSRREKEVRDILRTHIKRGKVYFQVSLQDNLTDKLDFKVKPESVKLVCNMLDELKETAGVKEEVTLEHILRFSEVFESAEKADESDDLWADFLKALDDALKELKKMRSQEAESLTDDIHNRLQTLENNLAEIEKISADDPRKQFDKLHDRVKKLIAESNIDPERLHTEIALIADKSDVTEECVRLRSHFKLFKNTIEKDSVVGKKMNFLVQELNREVNTIGSKANDAAVSHLCVNMKGEIEKIREQVQNLE